MQWREREFSPVQGGLAGLEALPETERNSIAPEIGSGRRSISSCEVEVVRSREPVPDIERRVVE